MNDRQCEERRKNCIKIEECAVAPTRFYTIPYNRLPSFPTQQTFLTFQLNKKDFNKTG